MLLQYIWIQTFLQQLLLSYWQGRVTNLNICLLSWWLSSTFLIAIYKLRSDLVIGETVKTTSTSANEKLHLTITLSGRDWLVRLLLAQVPPSYWLFRSSVLYIVPPAPSNFPHLRSNRNVQTGAQTFLLLSNDLIMI